DNSLARNRSKRERKDKGGRFAAFERLKKAKASGEKHKYEIEEEKSVYDVVDENEYSEIVRQRQDDDWIVDDDGAGYVEDGREIFDDDLDDDSVSQKKKEEKKKKEKNPNIVRPGSKPKTTIKSMFMAQTSTGGSKKKAEKDVSLANDDLLGDLMEELHSGPGDSVKPLPIKLKRKPAGSTKSPLNPFSTGVLKPSPQAKVIKAEPIPIKRIKSEPVADKPKPKPRLLPKPIIPDSENYDIDEVDSMDVQPSVSSSIQDIKEDDSEMMQLNDADFEDDVPMADIKSEVKVEAMTSLKPRTQEVIPCETVSTGWQAYKSEDQSDSTTDVQVDSLPLVANEKGEQVLRFYWLDAYEDQYNNPGTVYLFGKVWIESAKVYISCCVTVKNIERSLYILPRATRRCRKTGEDTGFEVSMVDVYTEFNERIVEKYKIPKFKSKKVTKQYAFEKTEVPVESDYLEVRYSAEIPALPSDLSGETFSHVFGTHTSSLEHLLIDCKMKGPGWLELKNPQTTSPAISWCKLEATLQKPDHIVVVNDSNLSPPPLVVMTMNLRTLPNPKTHQNEVIGAACLIQEKFHMDKPAPSNPFQQHFCVLSKPSDCILPYDFREKAQKESKNMKIEIMPNERALIGYLLARIHKLDPDVIVGHDIYGFDMDMLLHRVSVNKVPHWSKIGRLKRTRMPRLSGPGKGNMDKTVTCGRLLCDVKISAKELIRSRSYDLTELTNVILKQKRVDLDYDNIKDMFMSSRQLLQLVELTLVDSTYILRIMYELNILPLALQITNICGNVMARTLMGGRSERNEYLLLHAFTEKNFIVPDKEYKKNQAKEVHDEDDAEDGGGKSRKTQGRRKPAYLGGLVLEPKKGFYDKYILLLDFNSLYPSIIQEYNICFTTIDRASVKNQSEGEQGEGDALPDLPDQDLEPGVLPTEIRKLVESRRQVKQLMKQDVSAEQYMQYDIRQKALKLTANSMYGCLGFTFSRFYAKPLAALVTCKGREILMKTRDLVQAMNLDVIYGDTDSIMINTNSTDIDTVFKLGNKVKAEVNKLYRLLEIDIDGVFKSMLLLKKKKYAALNMVKTADGKYSEHKELKGLDIVRRDWCDLAKEAGNFVVEQILSGETKETILENIHLKLTEVGEKVKNGEIPVELYHITKQLTKSPEDYPDKKSLPHVQVALRYNSKGGKKLKAGDTVAYIVCQARYKSLPHEQVDLQYNSKGERNLRLEDGSNLPASQRAYHPDELAKSDTLQIDTKYYLAQQVHPVISRLCDPIEGTDAAHLAECLGLDPSGYRHAMRQQDDEDEALLGGLDFSEEEKFKDCSRLKFICSQPNCGREIIFDGVFTGAEEFIECTLAKCPNNECKASLIDSVTQIANQMVSEVRGHIRRYYMGWLKCEDTACGILTRKLPLTFQRGHPICAACGRGILHPELTDTALYHQLCFYEHVFDHVKALNKMKEGSKEKSIAKHRLQGYEEAYMKLKDTASRWRRHNAYSEVNLTKLFEGLFLPK
ncbi:hypothetical protein FSP39_001308, partial [Pinctada imbricata]